MFSGIDILSCRRDPARLEYDISIAFVVCFMRHIICDYTRSETGNCVLQKVWDFLFVFFKFLLVKIHLEKLLHLPFKSDIMLLHSKRPRRRFRFFIIFFGCVTLRV